MDKTIVWLAANADLDPLELALIEVDAAIAMVASGAAVTVRVCGHAAAEAAASNAAARAQAAAVAFRLRRETSGSVTLLIGPRLPPTAPAGRLGEGL